MGTGVPTATETAAWLATTLASGTHVAPVRSHRRRRATMHVLEITSPDGEIRRVLAKCHQDPPARGLEASRPALVPTMPAAQHFALEVTAAGRLHDLLLDLDAACAPEVVRTRTDPPIVVLELLEPSMALSALLLRVSAAAGWSRRRRAIAACAEAGRGIRRLTEAGPLAGRPTLHAVPSDLLETAASLARFIDERSNGLSLPAVSRVEELLDDVGSWEVAAGHGDFAPRNVLVLERGVAVIDALFAHNVPVVQDPARFVVNTLASLAEIPAPLGSRETFTRDALDAFLDGSGHVLDDPAFRAMCIVVTLDRWAALCDRTGGAFRGRVRRATGTRSMPAVLCRLLSGS